MKSLTLGYLDEVDFIVLAINSHAKGYKLCWEMNNRLKVNFIKNKYHNPEETTEVEFSRFTSEDKDLEIHHDLISNYSKGGHLLGAAGVIESIACIMAVKNNIVPPTINHITDDPEIDNKLNLTFNKAEKRKINFALSNTFGFGGHNASVVFKKYSNFNN